VSGTVAAIGLQPAFAPGRLRAGASCRTVAAAKGALVSGTGDEAKGRVKQAVGDLTDDRDLKREGKIDETSGKVKQAVDKVKDKLTGKD
jgi:uncharacterized protein YjbJ (UPF0337 family)